MSLMSLSKRPSHGYPHLEPRLPVLILSEQLFYEAGKGIRDYQSRISRTAVDLLAGFSPSTYISDFERPIVTFMGPNRFAERLPTVAATR